MSESTKKLKCLVVENGGSICYKQADQGRKIGGNIFIWLITWLGSGIAGKLRGSADIDAQISCSIVRVAQRAATTCSMWETECSDQISVVHSLNNTRVHNAS
jgi:hypothetical protein